MDLDTRHKLFQRAEAGDRKALVDLALAVIQLDERLERVERRLDKVGTQHREHHEGVREALLRSRFVRE